MTHFCYIIYSKTLDLYYVGETESTKDRIDQHNTNYYAASYSSKANDWEYVWIVSTINRIDARKIEAYIKSMKSRTYIHKLVNDKDFKDGFKEYVKNKLGIIISQQM